MGEIIDIIILILFVGLLIFLVAGFNRQQSEKHNMKMDEREEQQRQREKNKEIK